MENIIERIGMWLCVIATIMALVILVFLVIKEYNSPSKDFVKSCSSECKDLNLSFYKVDYVNSYGGGNYFCYCLDNDNLPRNIGVTHG